MYSETKIAIPIFQKDKESIIATAEDCIAKGADILEFRIDAIENPNPKMVREIIEEINFPIIATNRVESEGGSFKGSEEDRIAILRECGDIADYIDVELATDGRLLKTLRDIDAKTIISYHNFKKTPSLEFLSQVTVAISMGELGSYTRVIASKFNAPFTFAVANDTTAPGQIDIETMKILLNSDIIDTEELEDTDF